MALFNVNEKVGVKLTARGIEILRSEHEKYRRVITSMGEFSPPAVDAEGWSQFQMWELMHTFGEHCWNGCKVPFETTIQIHLPNEAEHPAPAGPTRSTPGVVGPQETEGNRNG